MRVASNQLSVTGARPALKVFGVLMVGAVLGILAVLPYQFALSGETLTQLGVPLPVIILGSLINGLLLTSIATAAGLWLGPRVGLGAPVIRGLLHGEKGSKERARALLPLSVVLGVLAALAIVVLDIAVFSPLLAQAGTLPEVGPVAPWKGLLASFYGGIVEELLLRLGLMTLLVWFLSRLLPSRQPGSVVMWVGIVAAALLFGAGHLPAASALMPLTPLWVSRILLLNTLPGIIFGWLYWRRGLLAAMVAHFTTDIVLHGIVPLVTG